MYEFHDVFRPLWAERFKKLDKYGIGDNINKLYFMNKRVVKDDNTAFVVSFDIPGVEKGDISVSIDGDLVNFTAKRNISEGDEHTYSYGITMQDCDDKDKVSSLYKNGVLTITIPRKTVDKKVVSVSVD